MNTIGISEVLFALLVVTAIIQLGFTWLSYRFLAYGEKKKEGKTVHPVSVIICARNESIALGRNLIHVLQQDYPEFEVVVVNDCSWDETGGVLEEISREYQRLKIVTIKEQEKYRHGKKFALTLGIKAAAYETLLFTDADCHPESKNWLMTMQKNFSREKEIVLGYGPYLKESGLINKLIRYDTFIIAIQYLSAAIRGKAYMGVGRNLAYTKSLFFKSKGFATHNHLLSGDDDLFVNENSNGTNTAIEISPESFTYSEPKKSFGEWMSQKKRHLSTAKYYQSGHKLSLALQGSSSFLFYVLLITLLVLRFEWRILLSLYLVTLLARFPVIYRLSIKLKEKDLAIAFPVLDLLYSFLQPLFYTANLLTKNKSWK